MTWDWRAARGARHEYRTAQHLVRGGVRRRPADGFAARLRHGSGGGFLLPHSVRRARPYLGRRPRVHSDGQLCAAICTLVHFYGLCAREGRDRRGHIPCRARLGRTHPRWAGRGSDYLVRNNGLDGRRDRRRDRHHGRHRTAGDVVARLQEGVGTRLHLRRWWSGLAHSAQRPVHHVRADHRHIHRQALHGRRGARANAGSDVHYLHHRAV